MAEHILMTPAQWFERYPLTQADIDDTKRVVCDNLEMGRNYYERATTDCERRRIDAIIGVEQATLFEMRMTYLTQQH